MPTGVFMVQTANGFCYPSFRLTRQVCLSGPRRCHMYLHRKSGDRWSIEALAYLYFALQPPWKRHVFQPPSLPIPLLKPILLTFATLRLSSSSSLLLRHAPDKPHRQKKTLSHLHFLCFYSLEKNRTDEGFFPTDIWVRYGRAKLQFDEIVPILPAWCSKDRAGKNDLI